MSVTLYGIKNCDTVKKARLWLEANAIDYRFHDFRVDGIDKKLVASWFDKLGWELLLNKRGTTWRKLPDEQKRGISKSSALTLMLEQPTVIKRPVLSKGKQLFVGFSDSEYSDIFSK